MKETIEIQKVVVPVDLSQNSEEALPLAFSLAREFKARLYLLYVYHLPSFLDLLAAPLAFLKGKEELAAEIEKQAQQKLSALIQRYHQEESDLQLEGLVRQGVPYEEILKVAQEVEASLIVICTRGLTGLEHLILGSTAERVVRMAECPVMTVRPRGQRSVMPGQAISLRKILAPVDFSPCSRKTLHYAIALAQRYKAELHLLTCNEGYVAGPEIIKGDLPPESRKVQSLLDLIEALSRRETEERFEKFLEEIPVEELGIPVERVIVEGTPYQEIIQKARELEAELIVMGTHGRTGLERVLLGSTTEKVVRLAPCAVMTVRGEA
ncbi:MAG: universal stress protein [Candidatus Tectomicrobia bacterium]|uniref:Universal stress protein n=1 Tax=Tectimicrobiota bacterium TaxID=2528274 RepID=A0A932CPX7_UNCTE|nr:universal stress protein [Candidatus Tectomicrobia bacterium]